jgi:hypothetical protein
MEPASPAAVCKSKPTPGEPASGGRDTDYSMPSPKPERAVVMMMERKILHCERIRW